jgi:peptidoglycan-N-acetylglucosamine deacetylase
MVANGSRMRVATFTVDVDRDVNLPANGKKQALSKCHSGNREEIRFDSSIRGLSHLCDVLEKARIRATFFFEGDALLHISKNMDIRQLLSKHEVACHGVCHEDITGESTGIPLTDVELSQMIGDGQDILRRVFARDPTGFRAPYQHIDQRTMDLLQKKGFHYDSSLTININEDGSLLPWKVSGKLWEIPLSQGKDDRGKRIVSYLWPMHEGKRVPNDYIKMADRMRSGVLVLATHAWHMTETYGQGMLSESSARSNLENVRMVLEGIMAQGLEFITLEEVVKRMGG